ncbi:MAG: hypothetical protein M1546_04175 [Chloroflexi bacterium]|nr:hypothetical protein [Chloroflexota bacterium]
MHNTIYKSLLRGMAVIAVLATAACGGTNSGSATPGADTPGADAPTGTAAGADVPSAQDGNAAVDTPDTASDVDGGTDTRDVADLSSGLDELQSYRQRFSYTVAGKDEQGKSYQQTIEFEQQVVNSSKEHHIKSTTTEGTTGTPGGSFELFVVGGATYVYSSDKEGTPSCFSFSSQESQSQAPNLLKPADLIGGIERATLLKRGETVEGILTDHYVFDEKNIPFGMFTSAKGDAWVAADGGYLVKYSAQATGKVTLAGQAAAQGEGSITWDYSLSDVNKIESITLPEVCEAQKPATDIPLPPNATEQANFGTMHSFNSPDAPADVAAFFKQALPAQGWSAGDETGSEDMYTLAFTKDGRTLTIMITKTEQGSSVVITEADAQ